MIDSLGGLVRVNNFLASLNLKPISNKNLKTMERRAGNIVEHVADMSTRKAAKDAFHQEMKEVAESKRAADRMEGLIEDLGVCPLPDVSPKLKLMLQPDNQVDDDWTDIDEDNDETDDVRRSSAFKRRRYQVIKHKKNIQCCLGHRKHHQVECVWHRSSLVTLEQECLVR